MAEAKPVQLKKNYYLPEYGVTIEATSITEAIEKVTNKKKKDRKTKKEDK